MTTFVPVPVHPDEFQKLVQEAAGSPSGEAILSECLGLARFLIAKNKAYGDSALKPLRIFSKAGPTEQIRDRIDDKLSRLSHGELAGEDAVLDLLGYLILLRLAERQEQPD